MRTLELLAPARDASVGRTAILAGADAVYIGAPAFGARAAATNTIADIAALADFAHRFRARVYVTMNTIVFDEELQQVEAMVWQLYKAGVDALIVQNPYAMGYLGVESAYKLLTGQGGSLKPVVDTSTQIEDRKNLFTMDGQKALFAFDPSQERAK